MIQSMTAYARQEESDAEGTVIWEVRSVNHRYLEFQIRLPELFRSLDVKLREILRTTLSRGKIDCFCRFVTKKNDNSATILLNEGLAQSVIQASSQVNQWLPNPSVLNSMDILQWPGVIQEEASAPLDLLAKVQQVFKQALDQLIDYRKQEGSLLTKVILERLSEIESKNELLRQYHQNLSSDQYQRLMQRLAVLKKEVDAERLEQEVALLVQRFDIAEEIDRLAAHCIAFRKALKGSAPVGRRFDFLLQEMNREVNTIGSKSSEIKITNEVIELKVLIEQIREQVQNIE